MPFEKVSGRASGDATISLRKSGGIGISTAAMEQWFEDAEGAEIYFDEEERRLGLKPVEESTDDSYSISRSNSGGSIVPMSILKRYNLVPEITKKYTPEVEKINGDTELITISVEDPVGTYGSPADEEEDEEE